MTLYSLRTALDDYRITKWDNDLNIESSYLLSMSSDGFINCECPAGHRLMCRHRDMLPAMLAADICDTEWFYDFERKLVVDANGNLRPKPEPEILMPSECESSYELAVNAKDVTPTNPWRRL